MEIINSAGVLAGSISAIIALLVVAFWRPIKKFRRCKQAEKNGANEFRKKVLEKLESITSDIADLQYERLSQAHDFYIGRGWCPTSKKNQLCIMYKSYTAKGRNHLSAHYEQDILAQPDEPEKKGEKYL